MIKIAFIIDTIESPTAGTEKQLLLLIKHLDRSKFEPYLCVLRSSQWLRDEFSVCPMHEVGITSFKKPGHWLKLLKFAKFLRDERFDIVQTHFADGNKVGVLAAKLAGVKAIVSTRRNQGYWHNTLERAVLRILNRWVKLFLANSKNTAEWVAKAEGISHDKIQVIYNGIELEKFNSTLEDRSNIRKQLGIPDNLPVIGIVANLRPVKGIDLFLNAATKVIDSYPSAHIIIVGEGEERQKLTDLSQKLGIDGNVSFLGRCENIPSLLAAFDIGVLSSFSESFSNSIVEYMAAGLPVVCTDVGGAREAIVDGLNGFVVPSGYPAVLANKLNTILSGSSKSKMGAESKKRAKELFSLSSMLDKYQKLYSKLAGVS